MPRWAPDDILIAFDSTHAAMAAQKLLKPQAPLVIPTPRAITASCGMTLVVRAANVQQARLELENCPAIAGQFEIYSGSSVQ